MMLNCEQLHTKKFKYHIHVFKYLIIWTLNQIKMFMIFNFFKPNYNYRTALDGFANVSLVYFYIKGKEE